MAKRNFDGLRTGLALSGGGFRAAAFHLGAFHVLREAGVLWDVQLLTCVSGGSIAGAFLALNWGDDAALGHLDEFLGSRSLEAGPVIAGALDPTETRLEKLADAYDRHLFGGKTLSDLSNGPRIYLNTTNLATGNAFSFVAGRAADGTNVPEMGEWELAWREAPNFRIAKAVAASSAFPPVFPPLVLDPDEYDSGTGVEYVALTDGGVYDNLGVNPLFLDRNAIDLALVSDGGKPFSIDDNPTMLGLGVLKQLASIQMEQIRGLEFKRLELSTKTDKTFPVRASWYSIDSCLKVKGPYGKPQEDPESRAKADAASAVGTRLKKLKKSERELLRGHAEDLARHRFLSDEE